MAKSSSFFGMRRGSTKAHTFSVYRGSQITKDRVTEITNPQTTKQMQQRVKMPLVAASRSILSGLINHSFQGIDYGWKSKANFSKLNLENLDIASYGAKGIRTTGIANYLVSEGSLSAPSIESDVEDTAIPFVMYYLSSDKSKTVAKDLNSLIDVILAGNDNLNEGDQLTFVYAYIDKNSQPIYINGVNRFAVASPTWKYYRLILSHDSALNTEISLDFDEADGLTYLYLGHEASLTFGTHEQSGETIGALLASASANYIPVMFTVIHSRYDENNKIWQRSTNRMTVNDQIANDATWVGKDYIVTQAQAIETYIKGTSSSSDYYLNEGGNATA